MDHGPRGQGVPDPSSEYALVVVSRLDLNVIEGLAAVRAGAFVVFRLAGELVNGPDDAFDVYLGDYLGLDLTDVGLVLRRFHRM